MWHYLGIDPGKQGGLSVLNERGDILYLETMPTEGTDISPHFLWECIGELRRDYPNLKAWIERVNSRPKSSGASMFTFGKGFGYLVMAIIGYKIPFQMVTPGAWTKEMHRGIGKQFPTTKDRSLASARRIWPDQSWLASNRSKKPHDGLFEAALIAEYGRRMQITPKCDPW